MTEFEEKPTRPDTKTLESFSKKDISFEPISEIFKRNVQVLKSWKEYAEYLEIKLQNLDNKVKVPQFVADVIESKIGENYSLGNIIRISEQVTAFNRDDSYHRFYEWVRDNCETFARAWLDGYEVEKEKRFYLKDKNFHEFVRVSGSGKKTYGIYAQGRLYERAIFKQSEIDKMEAGSYEKIEVEDGTD